MVFTTMDALVKALPPGMPVMQVAALRFAFGIPLVLLALAVMRAGWPTLSSWKANGPRGLLTVA